MRIDLGVPPVRGGMIVGTLARQAEERLKPFLAREPTEEVVGDVAYRVLSVDLPEGVGVDLPIGGWGNVGLGVEAGTLYVDAPILAGAVLRATMKKYVARTRTVGGLLRLLLALPKGQHVVVPIGAIHTIMLRLPAT